MASTTIYARKGKKLSISIIYRHHDESIRYSTGIRVGPEHWRNDQINLAYGVKDIKANRELIQNLKKQSNAYNAVIKNKKAEIDNIATRLKLDNIDPTIERESAHKLQIVSSN